jgi:hypothetical protein
MGLTSSPGDSVEWPKDLCFLAFLRNWFRLFRGDMGAGPMRHARGAISPGRPACRGEPPTDSLRERAGALTVSLGAEAQED